METYVILETKVKEEVRKKLGNKENNVRIGFLTRPSNKRDGTLDEIYVPEQESILGGSTITIGNVKKAYNDIRANGREIACVIIYMGNLNIFPNDRTIMSALRASSVTGYDVPAISLSERDKITFY